MLSTCHTNDRMYLENCDVVSNGISNKRNKKNNNPPRKRTNTDEPDTPVRQKTSYFEDIYNKNRVIPEDKIVFLITDKPVPDSDTSDDDTTDDTTDELSPEELNNVNNLLMLLFGVDPNKIDEQNNQKDLTNTGDKRPSSDNNDEQNPSKKPRLDTPRPPVTPNTQNKDTIVVTFTPFNLGSTPIQPPTSSNGKNIPSITTKTQDTPSPSNFSLVCNNPLCNHKTYEEDPTPPFHLDLQFIRDINDLITMGKAFHCKKQQAYRGINLRLMCNLVEPLTEMNDMIGMADVKEHIVNQILFFLQGFNTVTKCNKCQDCAFNMPCIRSNTEMMHTVITGPPGVGKTCLGRIMGKVYKAMGILSKGDFHEVTRADFVAEYLGQTAIKTKKLVQKCKGGVMFIDEAYGMGSKEKRDSFAKEAIDTLTKMLVDERDLLCIIAGYEKDLNECFFSQNEGLRRRFTFTYNVKDYDYKELLEIFKLKVKKEGWTIDYNSDNQPSERNPVPIMYDDSSLLNLFRLHKDKFPYCGGDIETYFLQCKIAHGKRLPEKKKCLSFTDLKCGLETFVKNRKHKKIIDEELAEEERPGMYVFN